MKTYTIYASQVIYFKKEVQANSKEEADALAFEYSEDNEWQEYNYGEWLTDEIIEEEITE
jgi:hypothetical protein